MLCLLVHWAWGAEPTLPVMVSSIPPVYPADALVGGLGSAVLLEIDVGADGAVSAVRVVESGGAAFDAAAVQAARSFRFTPVAATIRYRTVFAPSLAPALSVEGDVVAAGTRQPLVGVDVVLERGDERVVAVTDADGHFRIAGLADGDWVLWPDIAGVREEWVPVTVTRGTVSNVRVYPVVDRPWEIGDAEEIVVVGRRLNPEVTERTFDQEDVRYLPGTGGDVIRVVQNLPGVARPPFGSGVLVVRGTAPEDTSYHLDGAPIPSLFHFGGLSTVLGGDAIAEIALLSGNYGVRYGRVLGGVVDLRLDDELPERSRGYASLDVFQATLYAEQRFGRAAIAVSGRRSYIDAILNPVLSSSGGTSVRAPRYYDFQARMFGQTRSGGTLDALLLVSDDRFRVVGEDVDGVDEVVVGLTSSFQKVRLLWKQPLKRGWHHEASAIAGPEVRELTLDGVAYERPFTLAVREELVRPAPLTGLGWGLRLGTDAQVGWFRYRYEIPGFGTPEGADVARFAPAAYLEAAARLGALEVIPGARVDWIALDTGWTSAAFDPRLAARLSVGPSTTLEASVGGYSQFPDVREAVAEPSLGPQRSWQTSAGVVQDIGSDFTLEITAYDNWLTDLVSGREDAFGLFSGPPAVGSVDTAPYANEGTGRIYGVETLARLATERTTALLSLTVGRSTRIERPGGERTVFVYDQPVVVTVLGSRELPRRWRLGARFRASSGNPYTPVVNRWFDTDQREWLPVFASEADGERLPPFASLDLRVDKDWVFRRWTLTLYVDVQNTTNRQNVEVMTWSEDYTEETPLVGLPTVPAFGLRGEW